MRVTLSQSAASLTAICRAGVYYKMPSAPTETDVRAFVGFLTEDTARTSQGYQAVLWQPGECRVYAGMPSIGEEVFLTPTGPALYTDLAAGKVSRSIGVVGRFGLTLEPVGLLFTVGGSGTATVNTASPLTGDGSSGNPVDFKFNVRTIESYPETLEAWDSATCIGTSGAVNLPADPADGDQVRVVSMASGVLTISANGNEFTSGDSTFDMVSTESNLFEWNGSAWNLAG